MRKSSSIRFSSSPTFPPESANATWTRELANTGASNRWSDEQTASPSPSIVGGHNDRNVVPDDARIAAAIAASGTTSRDRAVAAIKMDYWKQRKEQMAASFSARPAARANDDTMKSLGARVGHDLRKAMGM